MPVPALITDLSTTPASNSPAGSESPNTADDYLRTYAAFIRQSYDESVKLTGTQTVAGDKTFSGTTALAAASATNVSYTGTLTGGTGVVNIGSGQLVKDASGNVGIGVTPSAWGSYNAIQSRTASMAGATNNLNDALFISNAYWDAGSTVFRYINGTTATQYRQVNSSHLWYIAPSGTAGNAISFTQAMTLDASGNLLVGTTSSGSPNPGISLAPGSNAQITIGHDTGSGSGQYYIPFKYNAGVIGGITQNGTTAVAYNTTSDYRLKENITPLTGALARVLALKPCSYTWKLAPDEVGEGFIAHELAEVCPQATTGKKDAVDAEGNPQYQGIDTSFLVATLAAAIQELKAELDALKAQVASDVPSNGASA